jgi:hypothetical protein
MSTNLTPAPRIQHGEVLPPIELDRLTKDAIDLLESIAAAFRNGAAFASSLRVDRNTADPRSKLTVEWVSK